MTRHFKSQRHAVLAQTFPADAIDKLLRSDVLQGPFRAPVPVTLTWRMRLARWVRSITTNRSPL